MRADFRQLIQGPTHRTRRGQRDEFFHMLNVLAASGGAVETILHVGAGLSLQEPDGHRPANQRSLLAKNPA